MEYRMMSGGDRPRRPDTRGSHDAAKAEHSATIVIVEDEFFTALESEHIARGAGMAVLGTAYNPAEAGRLIEELRPDMLMMDINLGADVDGIDIAEWAEREFGIRSIFVTAYSRSILDQRGAKCRPLGWIGKPVGEKELSAALREATRQIKPRD
jgi:YesN/AraC family two-component response regulator